MSAFRCLGSKMKQKPLTRLKKGGLGFVDNDSFHSNFEIVLSLLSSSSSSLFLSYSNLTPNHSLSFSLSPNLLSHYLSRLSLPFFFSLSRILKCSPSLSLRLFDLLSLSSLDYKLFSSPVNFLIVNKQIKLSG